MTDACSIRLPKSWQTCLALSLLTFASDSTLAAAQWATRTNAELGATFGTVDSADNSNKSAQGDFRLTVPVTTLLGASLRAYYADSNIQLDLPTALVATTSCSYEILSATGTLFARRPNLGRLGASVLGTHLESKCGSNAFFTSGNGDSLQSRGYSLAAEYYFSAVTVAAERTVASFDDESDRVADSFSATWYPLADLSLSSNIGRVDDRAQYGVSVESQPDFLGRGASVSLSFSDLSLPDEHVRTVNLSLTWHFGTRVDLKTRDREYR